MSWDQQTYSFGNPNAQPPTPTQTPTSGQFPSPAFQTPRNNNSSFEDRSGWTPTFAEEYSVFNSTPGRLINTQHSFAEASPRLGTSYGQLQHQSAGGDISAELASHVHHFSPLPNLPLPPVDPSSQLPSSPGPYQNRFDDSSTVKVTPKKPRKHLDEAFSGQTATPPATKSKGSRKLAPKISKETMQGDCQDSHFGSSQTPTQQSTMMSFTESSGDFFSYPMSAPATAPAFTSTKPFWDPDASMSGMDIDFAIDDGAMFNNTNSHKISNSLDWARNNQMFQETVNLPPPARNHSTKGSTSKRPRPLAPKLPVTTTEVPSSIPPFGFSNTSMEDPFSVANMAGGVDPGLLFSRPSSQSTNAAPEDAIQPLARPATAHTDLRPYQHQLRESRRDQEELRRSRSTRDNSRSRRPDRGTVSSPIRSSRAGLQRSVSDSRGRRLQDRVQLSRSGRISPVKQRPSILTSIPELHPPRTRTEVKFTIDANGRARTETVIVAEPRSTSGSLRGDEYDSSPYESSSDDEPILVPSRNSSFTLPNAPRLSRFETSRGQDVRRHSASGYSQSESSSQRSFRQDSLESEAETILEEDDGSGDATRELRKVMENRKKNQMLQRDPRQGRYLSNSAPRGNQYLNYGSINISPTTVTDPDGPTPSVSSSRSGTTRCVCANPDSEGFMIQCESCDNWLHAECVNIDRRSLPPVYICAFCAQTPNMRGGRIREQVRKPMTMPSSPLAHKSFKSFR